MKQWLVVILMVLLPGLSAHAVIQGKPVEYSATGVTLKGYLAYDDSLTEKRPGILVVHEWWGHNDYARRRAKMLAELGYVALAVDMYGDGKQASHPKEAGQFVSEIQKNISVGKARFMAAMEFLQKQDKVDTTKIAAMGYCFGGGIVLEMARQGVALAGVASFHGSLSTTQPAQPNAIKAKILVLHGSADKLITPENVATFKEEMKKAQADLEFVAYPGVQHSFTNPDADTYAKKFDLPVAYDEAADKDSWNKLKNFLTRIFK